jgi:diaminopimelate decarboxylase
MSTAPQGGVTIAGVPVAAIAQRWGTPVMIVDAAEVRARMREVVAAAPGSMYAAKALTAHAVLRMAADEGLDVLCASGGEVEAARRAGVPAARLHLHGNAKTEAELERAVEAGIGSVIVDTPVELERLEAIAAGSGVVQGVLLRVRPDVEVATHESIATGHAESKFGMDPGEAVAAARSIGASLRLLGFQAHAGSQVTDPAPFRRVLEVLADVAARARVRPEVLDAGGGFAVTYADEEPLDPAAVGRSLTADLAVSAESRGWEPAPVLRLEPGRSLVANAGVTVYRVVARKRAGGRLLVAVDGGMSDNLRPALYDAVHAVRADVEIGTAEVVTIVGRHCESGDVLARDVALPAGLAPGDLVLMAATGAYTYPLASAYNRVGRPPIVAVGEGEPVTWVRREDAADLDRLEVAPGRADRDHAEPPEGVTIRPARRGDLHALVDHLRVVGADERSWRADPATMTPVAVRRSLRRTWTPDQAVVLALDGREVVGSLGIAREAQPASRHVATFELAIAPGARRRGIGAALVARAFDWAREFDVEKLLLSVYPSNTPAIALYRRCGFIEEGRLARHSRRSYGDEDEILMAAWVDGKERS